MTFVRNIIEYIVDDTRGVKFRCWSEWGGEKVGGALLDLLELFFQPSKIFSSKWI